VYVITIDRLTSAPFIVCDKPGPAGSPTVLLYATYGTADDDEVQYYSICTAMYAPHIQKCSKDTVMHAVCSVCMQPCTQNCSKR
jgi:hypothetical protein